MKVASLLLLSLLLAGFCFALDPGEKAPNFTLKSTEGKEVHLTDFGGKTVVVMFIATRCPYSNAFTGVMAKLANQYSSKGIVFLGINSNKSEPLEEVALHAKQHFPFVVLKDDGNKVADAYKAQVTPESFVIDGTGVVRYHGALGSSNNPTTNRLQANSTEISAALDEMMAGKPVTKAKTKAFGCTIKRT